MSKLTFQIASFDALSTAKLYAILALRSQVFVVEQNCVYQDIDGKDIAAQHIMAFQDQKIVSYLRLLPKGIGYPDYLSLGRVVTAPQARGLGFGKQLMRYTLNYLYQHHHNEILKISAQLYLQCFYEDFGFAPQGEPYDEDGIPHIAMLLSI